MLANESRGYMRTLQKPPLVFFTRCLIRRVLCGAISLNLLNVFHKTEVIIVVTQKLIMYVRPLFHTVVSTELTFVDKIITVYYLIFIFFLINLWSSIMYSYFNDVEFVLVNLDQAFTQSTYVIQANIDTFLSTRDGKMRLAVIFLSVIRNKFFIFRL